MSVRLVSGQFTALVQTEALSTHVYKYLLKTDILRLGLNKYTTFVL